MGSLEAGIVINLRLGRYRGNRIVSGRILLTAALLGALLLLPPASAFDPQGPTAAAVVLSGTQGLLSWTPPAVLPDSYRVYGVASGSLTLLSVMPADAVSGIVPSGFASYAITAWHGGLESEPTFASALNTTCLTLTWDPPGFALGECEYRFASPPDVRAPRLRP